MKSDRKSPTIRGELRERLVSYIVAALGLVASLAWNEAIKGLIAYLFPLDANSLFAQFLYAAVLTAIVVIITVYLIRLLSDEP